MGHSARSVTERGQWEGPASPYAAAGKEGHREGRGVTSKLREATPSGGGREMTGKKDPESENSGWLEGGSAGTQGCQVQTEDRKHGSE